MSKKIGIALLVFAIASIAPAQENRYLSSALGVYVFPSEGQSSEQQLREEAECYGWAVERAGVDPFELQKLEAEHQQQTEAARQQADRVGEGAPASGAVGGAAAGALIGGISRGGKGARRGAAAGAVLGVIGGAAAQREARDQAQQQVEQQSERQMKATKEQQESFRRAFSVCMESKNYMVR